MTTFNLLQGDALERLKELPDNSIDSIVTDPPYGLSKQPDMLEVLQHWLNGDDYKHNSKGFMGKAWDSFVPGPSIWKECLRVLKPGGHMVAFFGTRTYDLGVLAIRLAGFEIRDQIAWVYGSGFPKSLDVSKAIDKAAGADREIVGEKRYGDGHVQRSKTSIGYGGSNPEKDQRLETTSTTDAAKQWEGWGTALKPAFEPIVLARKPLTGTVAENVVEHGVGAINIDGCRVDFADNDDPRIEKGYKHNASADYNPIDGKDNSTGKEQSLYKSSGRFPANLIHDGSEEVVSLFPETASGRSNGNAPIGNPGRVTPLRRGQVIFRNDDGSAARFFYCAKASSSDRDEGLDGTNAHGETNRKNTHPTVKPTTLMRYLCRLITPTGGTILDPFMGSGSTGKAAMYEGFDFVGVELLQDHMEIAEARIAHAKKDAYEISIGAKKSKTKKSDPEPESDVDITKFFG